MNSKDKEAIIAYNRNNSCKISDLNISFIESLKVWLKKKLLNKKDKKTIRWGIKDSMKYPAAMDKQQREDIILRDKLSGHSNTVCNLYSEITGALAYDYTGDKFQCKELSIELRNYIIENLYIPCYNLLKRKARDFYESSKEGYESEAEINILAKNITTSVDKDMSTVRNDNYSCSSELLLDLVKINEDLNYNELFTTVYTEDYSTAKIDSNNKNNNKNRNNFIRDKDNNNRIKKNLKDYEYDLLVDMEEESEVYLDIKPVRINIDEVTDKLSKIDYKSGISEARTRLNNERVKFNREHNLKGKKNYIISFNNSRLKSYNKITVLETEINKFFNNILISKIILDTQDSIDSYVNLYQQFSHNYYSFGDFNYLYSYEIKQYRKQVDEDIKNNTGIYDKNSLELNNYMPKHIMDIYRSHLNNTARFNGELILVNREKKDIDRDKSYMDVLIDYYREDKVREREKNKNKKKRGEGHAPVKCSSFEDYIDLTVGLLINKRINTIVDKYNLDESKGKYSFISFLQKHKYKYVDEEYAAPLTDLFLFYFNRDTIDLLNYNCFQKIIKNTGSYKERAIYNTLYNMYYSDKQVLSFKRKIDSKYFDGNNNLITGQQSKNLTVQLHKELYYRVFNLSYLTKAIEDRVKKIIARYYYIEYMNNKKKISDKVKDEKNTYYNYKNKLIKREYSVAANENMLFNIEDLFKDEYIDYLDHCNKFTINDNFLRAKDAEPWYEESDRFMDIPLGEKLTLFEEYTLVDNNYIIEEVAKPIVVKFNELVNKIVLAKNKKSVLSNIQKLVRLTVNLEGITNITNSYINEEYDYRSELNEELDNYRQNILDFIDDNIIMSRRSNIFREYFDLVNFAFYENNIPYRVSTDSDRSYEAFNFKNIIDKPGDTDCKDHFWLSDYEEIFKKRVIKENHKENLNWPDYNNTSEISSHMINYIDEIAESRVLYKIKVKDIEEL